MNSPVARNRRSFLGQTVRATLAAPTLMHIGSQADAAEPDRTSASRQTRSSRPAFLWRKEETSLALLWGDVVIWQHNHGRDAGKPYFHPVCLPDGTPLTWLRPPDHLWHRGLWFAWKFLNGLNYWDPDIESEGRTTPVDVNVTLGPDFAARIALVIQYHPANKDPVLVENRRLRITAPEENGGYVIAWSSTFTAREAEVRFDRTPIPGEKDGVDWGGYAGLSLRVAQELGQWQVLNSEGQHDLAAHGRAARWMDFSGVTSSGRAAGAAIFDHPNNPRHPTPWYVSMATQSRFGYFSPAFLFNEAFVLPAGRSLKLAHAILLHAGRPDVKRMEEWWKKCAADQI